MNRLTFSGPPPTVIRAGARFDGVLVLHRPARIDGRVAGEVLAQDCLWIGEEAQVEARIRAREVVIAGQVSGSIEAAQRIEVLATAHVRSELASPVVAVAEGCWIEGHCRTGKSKTASLP